MVSWINSSLKSRLICKEILTWQHSPPTFSATFNTNWDHFSLISCIFCGGSGQTSENRLQQRFANYPVLFANPNYFPNCSIPPFPCADSSAKHKTHTGNQMIEKLTPIRIFCRREIEIDSQQIFLSHSIHNPQKIFQILKRGHNNWQVWQSRENVTRIKLETFQRWIKYLVLN